MNKKLIILDLVCYGAIPFLIWRYGRDLTGDYWAMLLSTVPGFIYTVYRFAKERQFNIAGLFIIGSLLIGTTVDLLSGNAENMLWNQVYLGYGFAFVFLLSMMVRKPLGLYFAVDWAYLQGFRRKDSLTLFSKKGLFQWYQLVTLLFVLQGVFQNTLKAWLIYKFGVDGYDQVLIYRKISGYIFSAMIFGGFMLAGVKTNNYLKEHSSDYAAKSFVK
ncbi:VC0807 family protein [Lentibacillus sp. L22]|uniref:VC0807 family protein n=1 Tax=Lentibacillus TaxID=175304 RepID=UPI0022B0DCA5|nr:VC0807 family protein [Lentibacillus daqui]